MSADAVVARVRAGESLEGAELFSLDLRDRKLAFHVGDAPPRVTRWAVE